MPVKKLKEFLDKEKIKYVSIVHSTAYTAQEVAASAHITGRELAKTVIVQLDGEMAMAVLPANRKIILQDLREVTGLRPGQVCRRGGLQEEVPGLRDRRHAALRKPLRHGGVCGGFAWRK